MLAVLFLALNSHIFNVSCVVACGNHGLLFGHIFLRLAVMLLVSTMVFFGHIFNVSCVDPRINQGLLFGHIELCRRNFFWILRPATFIYDLMLCVHSHF